MKSMTLFPDRQMLDQLARDDGRLMSRLISKDYLDDEFETGFETADEEEEQAVRDTEDEEDV